MTKYVISVEEKGLVNFCQIDTYSFNENCVTEDIKIAKDIQEEMQSQYPHTKYSIYELKEIQL